MGHLNYIEKLKVFINKLFFVYMGFMTSFNNARKRNCLKES